MHRQFAVGFALALLGGTALARAETLESNAPADPFAPMNRGVYGFNERLDHHVLTPIVTFHNNHVPRPARVSIRNFLHNLGEPVTFMNDSLQVHPRRAGESFARFGINTTIGVLGLMDVAGGWGIAPHAEDFGQTLGNYGVGEGPYLVLPVLGSSSVRDFSGLVVDSFLDPLNLITFEGRTIVTAGLDGATIVADRAHEVKDEIRYAEAPSTYEGERAEYRVLRRAEIENRDGAETLVAEAPPPIAAEAAPPEAQSECCALAAENAPAAEPAPPPQGASEAFGSIDELGARLQPLGLNVIAVDRTGADIVIEVKTAAASGPLPCEKIWDAAPAADGIGARSVTFTQTGSGAHHMCRRFLD